MTNTRTSIRGPVRRLSSAALIAAYQLAAAGALVAGQFDVLSAQESPGHPQSAAEGGEFLPAGSTSAVAISYDDGETDGIVGPGGTAHADFVMRFDLPQSNMQVGQLSACFSRAGSNTDLDFTFTFWEANGPGGAPGTFIASVPATAQGVASGATSAFRTFDLSAADPPVILPSDTVYIGVGWPDDPPAVDFLVCYDSDRPTVQPGYVDFNHQENWQDLTTLGLMAPYTALLLRGVFTDLIPSGPCVPDDTTMCLLDGRFRVQVDWATQFGTSGPGHVVPLGSDNSGMFYFFNPDNWEMLLKMLDACSLDPPRFWVFFAATTNVEFTVTVTDTEADVTKFYVNELGHRADAVTDTNAFATCP